MWGAVTGCLWLLLAGEAPAEVELVRDPHFRLGFRTQDPKPGKRVYIGRLAGFEPAEEPPWSLAQWTSRFPIATLEPERLADGALRYANEAKTIVLGPAGSEQADLTLGVNGPLEYDGRARQKGEPWVHLLLGQRFECPWSLAEATAARLSIEARLLHSRRTTTPDYSPNLHAAQYQIFVTVQNLNRQSPGYGDYLWFGVSIYDDRRREVRGYVNGDAATGKLIYSLPSATWSAQSTHDGEWVTLGGDLLPHLLRALETAWERGFLKDSRDLADYRLGGMNLGWEVPGLLDVALQCRNLSIRYTGRAKP